MAVCKNVICLEFPILRKPRPKRLSGRLTFGIIQDWVKENYDLTISKSSITRVKEKCGINLLDYGAKATVVPELKTYKEKVVLEAFKHYGIVDDDKKVLVD